MSSQAYRELRRVRARRTIAVALSSKASTRRGATGSPGVLRRFLLCCSYSHANTRSGYQPPGAAVVEELV